MTSNTEMSLQKRLIGLIEKGMAEKTDLCLIMNESGSDKCSDWHNYTSVYSEMFDRVRQSKLNVFEIGIFKGCSVRGWKKYFSNSKIYAADVEKDYLVNQDGIFSFLCDQDDIQSIELLWKNFDTTDFFDIIIDDGKHEFNSNLNFLNHSIQMLKKGGIFIIEDLTVSTKNSFEKILDELKNSFGLEEVFLLDIPNKNNSIDNCLLVIRK